MELFFFLFCFVFKKRVLSHADLTLGGCEETGESGRKLKAWHFKNGRKCVRARGFCVLVLGGTDHLLWHAINKRLAKSQGQQDSRKFIIIFLPAVQYFSVLNQPFIFIFF